MFWQTHENNHTHVHKQKHEVFKTPIVVQIFPDGVLPIGQYTFPFSFALPDWLPSSFVFKRNFPDQAHMRLKYKAVAKMKDGSGSATPLHPMEAKRPLMIT